MLGVECKTAAEALECVCVYVYPAGMILARIIHIWFWSESAAGQAIRDQQPLELNNKKGNNNNKKLNCCCEIEDKNDTR